MLKVDVPVTRPTLLVPLPSGSTRTKWLRINTLERSDPSKGRRKPPGSDRRLSVMRHRRSNPAVPHHTSYPHLLERVSSPTPVLRDVDSRPPRVDQFGEVDQRPSPSPPVGSSQVRLRACDASILTTGRCKIKQARQIAAGRRSPVAPKPRGRRTHAFGDSRSFSGFLMESRDTRSVSFDACAELINSVSRFGHGTD